MNKQITQTIEDRPELGLDYRALWCRVIDHAIEESQTEYDPEELESLSLMTMTYRTEHRKESRYKKLCNIRKYKEKAKRFLESDGLDSICATFLTNLPAEKIREGIRENPKLIISELMEVGI